MNGGSPVEFEYNGYNVTARAEQQPGRWLPVADLEIYVQGHVTVKSSSRPAARGVRAGRRRRRLPGEWRKLGSTRSE